MKLPLPGLSQLMKPLAAKTGVMADVAALLDRVLPGGSGVLPDAAAAAGDGPFVDGSFSNGAGTRPYKLYVPPAYRGTPCPLVVMLHGCTQSPADFAAGTQMNAAAEMAGCLVLYPGQTNAANAQKCWNWFMPADQARGSGEPSLIAGMTRQVMDDYAIDPRRVYVAGLSAGGAAAVVLGAAYPELFAAVGVHSGLALGAAHDMGTAFMAMQQGRAGAPGRSTIPTIVFHGDRDTMVNPANADAVVAQAIAGTLRRSAVEGREPGGHAYTKTAFADAAGRVLIEQWTIHGAGHAWSGGSPAGSYTDAQGPDATREMLRFFLDHPA